MGFKIRDKSLFFTTFGYRNNYENKFLFLPKRMATQRIFFRRSKDLTVSHLRFLQHYRNYSRTIKQYLMGNEQVVNLVLSQLRIHFHMPFHCDTPLDKFTGGVERRLGDSLDRDYQQITYNTHPTQVALYNTVNRAIRKEVELNRQIQLGQTTEEDVFIAEVKNEIENQKLRNGGEQPSIDKIGEIILKTSRNRRLHLGERPAKQSNGEFNDFLEKRRPFMESGNLSPST